MAYVEEKEEKSERTFRRHSGTLVHVFEKFQDEIPYQAKLLENLLNDPALKGAKVGLCLQTLSHLRMLWAPYIHMCVKFSIPGVVVLMGSPVM